ncbi:hypothetical protein [Longimicrobium terrae]|uniref:Uncharacterized protein n=1 Tax=Longimicrobium terrae TaxID=1639882 RepID=A0A841GXG6_9BACT|nr:hypothetical protein [Longimicrobium terrae]MBB4635950.1 hypothetical protein [Longimicrobium terrae]MBB6070346.1 hypothetical protein [Longimicrobium terrae]NNC30843.1 hypothetical protein [Longimicrobium terrae]
MNRTPQPGDRVAWSEHGRGVVVDGDTAPAPRRRPTVAILGPEGFRHVTRIPASLLYSTPRLHSRSDRP